METFSTMKLDQLSTSGRRSADLIRGRAELAARGDRGPGRVGGLLVGLLGAAFGAAAAFLFDPARGRARRARLTDQGAATVRRITRQSEGVVRRVRSDVEGKLAATRAAGSVEARPLDDATLTDRVQSVVFRDPSVPKGDLNINVERGIVVLRGEIPDEEMRARIVSEVEAVEGVWSVRDLLHLPGQPAPTAAVPS
jgi:osmotically-inducible protein OsmY